MIGKRSTSNHQKQSQLSSVLNSMQNILYINLKFKVTEYTFRQNFIETYILKWFF